MPRIKTPSTTTRRSSRLSPLAQRIEDAHDDAFDITDVDLDDPEADIGEFEIVDGEDGSLLVTAIEEAELVDPLDLDHNANLAEHVPESLLAALGHDLVDKVDQDKEDRQPWVDRFTRGMAMLGLVDSEMDDGPFPGASTAILPLLSEACVQFWARSLPELYPPEGPAKVRLPGTQKQAQVIASARVAEYMNHQMTVEDRGYYAETSRLLAALPYQGCTFRKTYFDALAGHVVGVFVAAEDLIVPGTVTALASAPRYTHRIFRTPNEVRKLQASGVYRRVDLGAPVMEQGADEIRQTKREMSDVQESTTVEAANHELYEVYAEVDLEGFEDRDELGEPTGIELPYIVTVDRHSGKVLSIYRNWRSTDAKKRARRHFTKYSYLPGVGFYDIGLFHALGGLQEAATGALRLLLDGSAMASLQGGFVAKDANIKAESLAIEPGVWKPIESTADEFNKAFLTPPFREPSPQLFQLLGVLTSAAQRFTSTTEAMTGEAQAKGAPVGSVVALIEQGHKVYSAIHRGLHASCADELEVRLELARENVPEDGYPYEVGGDPRTLYMQDFAPGTSVIPVSDPNIFSTTQRIQIAQGVLQTAGEHPDLIDRKVAVRRFLEAMKVPDIDELMSISDDPEPMDPVSENAALLVQKPIKAFPEQDHMAHIQVHLAFMQHQGFGGHPQVSAAIGPAMQAHIGEHLAYAYQTQVRMAGLPVPVLDPITGKPTLLPNDPQVPPEVIAQMAAQFVHLMGQMQGLPGPNQGPGGQPGPGPEQGPPPEQPPENPMAKAEAEMATAQAKTEGIRMQAAAKAEATQMQATVKAQADAEKAAQKLAEEQAKAEIKQADREAEATMRQIDRLSQRQHDEQRRQARTASDNAKVARELLKSAKLPARSDRLASLRGETPPEGDA